MNVRSLIIIILRGGFYLYKGCIAPFVAGSCRYYPSCSEYCVICLERYGIFQGAGRAFRRLMMCRPGSEGGVDFP